MRLTRQLLTFATATLLLAPAAQAQNVSFDDLPNGGGCGIGFISNGYKGLNWNNFAYLRGTDCGPNNGYVNGTLSADFVGFNAFGNAASFSKASAFTWSGYLTAAWRNNLDVTIVGSLNGNQVYSQTSQLSIAGPTLFSFGQQVDLVIISAANGTNPGNLGGDGTHVAFDDVTINSSAVPEPASLVLLSAGLGLVVVAARRRRV